MSSGQLSDMDFNSSILPMECWCPHSHSQMFSGVPQYRFRLIPQSWTFSNQSPKRPFPIFSGIQWIVLLLRIRSSFTAVIFINQDSRGIVNKRCVTTPAMWIAVFKLGRREKKPPRLSKSSRIRESAFLQNIPALRRLFCHLAFSIHQL